MVLKQGSAQAAQRTSECAIAQEGKDDGGAPGRRAEKDRENK
jgi:hypothetical protein